MEGEVRPPLEGVAVTVTAQDGSMEPIVLKTGANGKYRSVTVSRCVGMGPSHGGKFSLSSPIKVA
jgi:hypothetical protein